MTQISPLDSKPSHQAENMASVSATPPISRSSSQSPGDRKPQMFLDLSDVPSLVEPTPPSNTLLISNLNDPAIFVPSTLNNLRDLISQHSSDGIHTFSPLRSLRRIIIAFKSTDSALEIRRLLDGEVLYDNRIRVYFGEPTPIEPPQDQHLQAPRLEKQFLISPPPSPPVGWQGREEDPPNKEVHADDLASALARLSHRRIDVATGSHVAADGRQRSGSATIVYHPEDHGHSPDLPAIAVEDTTESPGNISPILKEPKTILAHTARPPVELMEQY